MVINLSEEEKKIIAKKLLDHDTYSKLGMLTETARGDYKLSKEKIFGISSIIKATLSSIEGLCGEEGYLVEIDNLSLESIFENINNVLSNKKLNITSNIKIFNPFNSDEDIITSMLYNLTKNAYQVNYNKGVNVNLSAEDFSGEIQNPLFISDETLLQGDFVRFNVHDDGKGFMKKHKLEDYIKLGMSTRNSTGFGLFYASRVCKYLRSHLVIDSKKGDTNISIYHPLTLK